MKTIKLQNPSFEDTPRKGGHVKEIKGWFDCGHINFPDESAPDIHPGGYWGVDDKPYEGETYLGLVVRDNETWESVCQKLVTENGIMIPMMARNCYRLSMAVARSEKYMSGSRFAVENNRAKAQAYNYTTPVVVRIWGGSAYCIKKELLAKSEPITNSDWETIELDFTPTVDSDFLTIEAFYDIPVLIPYNGHVLIDNLSDIIQVACKN